MRTIVIDPGHGPSCVNGGPTGYKEAAGMWALSKRLKAALEGLGYAVRLTRAEHEDPGLRARGEMGAGAALFISQHSNAMGAPNAGAARGVEVFYSVDLPGDRAFAAALSKAVSTVMVSPDRGAKTRESEKYKGEDFYGVIDAAQDAGCPHVLLIESGFHDNLLDESLLKQDAKLGEIAEAQAAVIHQYLGGSAGVTANLTPIAGKASATAGQMTAYIKKVNPAAPQAVLDLPALYLAEGAAEGIRGDVALAQALLETGNFTFQGSAVTLDQNNFCGLGVTSNGMKGNAFLTPRIGVQAQIQHLKAYANAEPLKNTVVDLRFGLVKRGCAPFVEHLGQKENPSGLGWAAGAGYGAKILKILAAILAMPKDAPTSALPSGVVLTPIQIDGKEFKIQCVNIEGRLYPRLNALCEALDFKLRYDDAVKMAILETR